MGNTLPSPDQIRAAMALLKWENAELAEASGVSVSTVFAAKTGKHKPQPEVHAKIKKALEQHGIEFLDFNGVRQRPEGIQVFQGIEGFSEFYDLVFDYLRDNGGDVCIGGSDASLYTKYRANPEVHRKRMAELADEREDLRVRILCQEGDYNFVATSYASYRWQPKEYFSPTTFYTFGDYLALISFFHNPAPHVVVITSKAYADAYKKSFNEMWEKAKEPPPRKEK